MMKQILLLLLLAISIGPAYAEGTLPEEVEKFLARREGCDHFRGEIPEPNQKARMREIEREIRRLCAGTDKQLGKLKKKYASDRKIMKMLNEFDPAIEKTNW